MKKKLMTLMMGTLLLLTACGQTRDNSTSTMLPVAAVQSAAQGVAGVADKTADKAEMPQKEEKTEDSADAPLPVERANASENADNAAEKQPASAETPPPTTPEQAATPVAASLGNNANGTGRIHPLLRRHHKAVQPCLTSKRIEFDTVKIWIVECFPHTEKLDGVSIAKPVLNDVPWIVIILDFCNVCQAEKVIPLEIPLHIDLRSANN